MTLTFNSLTIEVRLCTSLFVRVGQREWWFEREPQNSSMFFSRRSQGAANVEVWGLGWYGCWGRA